MTAMTSQRPPSSEGEVRDTHRPYYVHGYEIWQGPKTGSWRVRRYGDTYLTWGFDTEAQAREFARRVSDHMCAGELRALYAEVRGEEGK